MTGPLNGLKVIDSGRWIQGPGCAAILGDLGADVIKIEDREQGDSVRGMQSLQGRHTGTKYNYLHDYVNRSKRSMALDLSKDEGRQVLYRMVQKTDVFIHNLRPDVPEKLGFDYKSLAAVNPGLIYAQGSGWGPTGPIANEPAMDMCGWARSGGLYCFGGEDMPPLMHKGGIGDMLAAITMLGGILAGLYARQTQGIGQFVDTSLLGSLIGLQGHIINYSLLHGEDLPRRNREDVTNPLFNIYKCGDGKWIALAMMQADKYWASLCQVLGFPELINDPKYGNIVVRGKNARELLTIMDRAFLKRSRDEWGKLFAEEGVVYSPVFSVSEVCTDPQAQAAGYIREFDHPAFGHVKAVGSAYNFSKTPAVTTRAAPEHGEHTEEILLEFGYNWDQIADLKKKEVIP